MHCYEHQFPEWVWMIPSHMNYFIQGEVLGFQSSTMLV